MSPSVSLIITTYNRANLLASAFETLQYLTLPDEVIVVDDGSDDQSVRSVCERHTLETPVRYVRNEPVHRGTRCQPTNVAIKRSSGDLIIHSDPEVEFLSDIVDQYRKATREFPDNILAPDVAYHDTYPYCQIEACRVIAAGDGLHATGGPCYAYRRDWLLEVGGWDESLGWGGWDDLDLHTRLSWIGHSHVAVPGAQVRHHWHEEMDWSGSENKSNADIVQSKRYPQDLVANVDREWGVVRP